MEKKQHKKEVHHEQHRINKVPAPLKETEGHRTLDRINITLSIVLLILFVFSIYQLTGVGKAPKIEQPNFDLTLIVDSTCKDCFDVSTISAFLGKSGKVNENKLEYTSSAAKKLIDKYGIDRVPAALISGELDKAPAIKAQLSQGGKTVDGTIVITALPPPFVNITTGKVQGLVEVTFITDISCKSCYDVQLHKQALSAFGLTKFSKETTVDVASPEGQALVTKYNIKSVPTMVLSSGASAYSLDQIWSSVGTVESDGSYVFRTMSAIKGAVYRDLVSGKIMGVVSNSTTTQ